MWQKNYHQIIFFSVVSSLALLLGAFFTSHLSMTNNQFFEIEEEIVQSDNRYHVSSVYDEAFFLDAVERAYDFGDRPESRVWVLPHHLVPRELTAGFLEAQAKIKNPKTIFVVGPDHLNRAAGPLVTTDLKWKTPFGFIEPDTDYINEIVDTGIVTIDQSVFDEEHSVSALTPLLKYYFPDSKIVPLLVRSDVDPLERYQIVDILADDMTTLVASVDFSHYMPSEVAQLHDVKSLRALQNRSYKELSDLEIDSAATLAMAFDFAEQTASEEFDFYIREDSDSFFGYPVYETTSYILGGYTHVEQLKTETVSVLAMGDIMFSRFYNQAYLDPFTKIAGLEDRFFQGADVIVGNLEGAIAPPALPQNKYDFAFADRYATTLAQYNFDAVSLANNHSLDQGENGYRETVARLNEVGVGSFGHQSDEKASVYTKVIDGKAVSFVGINLIAQSFNQEMAEEIIRQTATDSDYTVAMVHWGEEYVHYPTQSQQQLGRNLVDWGADAVIGAHPHVTQGMEVYKNAPILWSLGNFVFDQQFSEAVQRSLAAGIVFSPSKTTVYVYPTVLTDKQPHLATTTREAQLNSFFEYSTLSNDLLKNKLNGIVEIAR